MINISYIIISKLLNNKGTINFEYKLLHLYHKTLLC